MVLWIGYLQWHFRTYGKVNPPEPVLRDFHNIEHRDALITYDAVELITDESGKPDTRWDGLTYKISPITGSQFQTNPFRSINTVISIRVRLVATGRLHRRQSTVYRCLDNATGLGRRLCRCCAQYLA